MENNLFLHALCVVAQGGGPGWLSMVDDASHVLLSWWRLLVYVAMGLMCLSAGVIVSILKRNRRSRGRWNGIAGPRGWPVVGSLRELQGGLAHRRLASLAVEHGAKSLMALRLGAARLIITSRPDVARDLLCSSEFAERPLKESARLLLFGRAIGFAPYGDYWRNLRRIAGTYLFSPKRIASHERFRQAETSRMLQSMWDDAFSTAGVIRVRSFLQRAALNNIMVSVFGRRYDFGADDEEAARLQQMVKEGFELLGAFNLADYLPLFNHLRINYCTPSIRRRCTELVSLVQSYVQNIIDEHRQTRRTSDGADLYSSDFVDVLISLQKEEKLSDSDMIAILWEMIFRGTDSVAILTEWALAELVMHPEIQSKVQAEVDSIVGRCRHVTDSDVCKMRYLQAVVKETLRVHPPGPLLSWARLSTNDTVLAGHLIPRGTTAMVNMWAITHDKSIWSEPREFVPERFMLGEGGDDVDIRGSDLRLAPFGSGRRVCPGRVLALTTVHLWLARLVHQFTWVESPLHPVNMSEVLHLSCQMVYPLSAHPIRRIPLPFQIPA